MSTTTLAIGGLKDGSTTRRIIEAEDPPGWALAAATYLARLEHDVQAIAGHIRVDGMAMSYRHAQALARQHGWPS